MKLWPSTEYTYLLRSLRSPVAHIGHRMWARFLVFWAKIRLSYLSRTSSTAWGNARSPRLSNLQTSPMFALLFMMAASPALALRLRSSLTSHRCSPISMGPPDRSGRRLGGRQPDEQPPAARPRTDEERVALSRADELPATLLPEPTPVSVIAIAGGGLLACVLAAMMLLGSGSSDSYYYSSSFEQVTVTSRGEDGQARVETRQQRSVKTNIPQRALGETAVNAITGY